jgi:hypothetical protein
MLHPFTQYELRHIATGTLLYTTTASTEEILSANQNLRERELPMRYFQPGQFHIPQLHDSSP